MMIVVSSRHLTRDIPQTFVISTLTEKKLHESDEKANKKTSYFFIFSVKVYDNLLCFCVPYVYINL